MFNQHAKWLESSRKLAWRRPIASLNYLLTSHVWRQDHNGFSQQDPGFVDLVANKKTDIVRVYLPPDANCLLWVMDHCLRTYDRVNVIVAGKQPAPQWLAMEEAARHCAAGVGIWSWASNDQDGSEPDVVMACAGDVPTLETIAAVGRQSRRPAMHRRQGEPGCNLRHTDRRGADDRRSHRQGLRPCTRSSRAGPRAADLIYINACPVGRAMLSGALSLHPDDAPWVDRLHHKASLP